MKITVLGAGGWGTALARLLIQNGHQVTLWSWQQQQADEIGCFHENRSFLPGVLLPETLHVTCDMKEALSKTELVVFAVPSNASADVAAAAQPFIDSKVVLLNAAKGFAKERSLRISEVLREIYPENPIAVLSGPSHAEEVGRDKITALCVAGEDPDTLCLVQDLLSNDHFRVYVNHDLVGVEIGGAVKNVIALCCGILDGLELGDNARAALMSRGLAEIERLGVAMGADPRTFFGLTGVGDLVVTCTSKHSRNYRTGYQIGQGRAWRDILSETNMVVEGIYAAKCAHKLAAEYEVEMPITAALNSILYEDTDPRTALEQLMSREKAEEWHS